MGFIHLRVYQAAIRLRAEADCIIAEMSPKWRAQLADVIKHLDEALNSIRNNIAEGNDTRYPAKKNYYLDVALGSCLEARSGLNALVQAKVVSPNRAYRAIGLTIVIEKMLRSVMSEN